MVDDREHDGPQAPRELWRHSNPSFSRMYHFKEEIQRKHNVVLESYADLYAWSLTHPNRLWEEIWHFTAVRASAAPSRAFDEEAPLFPRPPFFADARLNFAENLLHPSRDVPEDDVAIIAATEDSRERVSWKQLRHRVARCAGAMRAAGLVEGDRVAGYLANHANTVVAMLGAASVGAIWTGVSPDTGAHAVLERLLQIEPTLLFADNAVFYNGRTHDMQEKVREVIEHLPSLKGAVVFETLPSRPVNIQKSWTNSVDIWTYKDFVSVVTEEVKPSYAQLQPDHPLYILYSSGTTGKPKCIVHGAIGTLIQHKKEHEIHCDIRPSDVFFYFTTCTWMMWHWLVSGLASGATIVLYDGSPFRPLDEHGQGELAMPKLVNELCITHFGTSAKYLSLLEQKGILPKQTVQMSSLRAIYSTGSPLSPSTFDYVYRAFGPDINLGSITGGTDIISLFGAPSLLSPVYVGEVQVRGLGMAVEAWDDTGKDITNTGEAGELVCTKPFPCQPLFFWGSNGQELYRASYFDRFPDVWHHGDFVKINPRTGGMAMLGRSDGVLKPAGVRFGSAEIYNVLLLHFPDEIQDALCVGRKRESDTDETVVLFLKMTSEHVLDERRKKEVQDTVRKELSARHVPGIVDECPDIPVTSNGKKVEVVVKKIICDMTVKNSTSVANAECLDWYRQWSADHP